MNEWKPILILARPSLISMVLMLLIAFAVLMGVRYIESGFKKSMVQMQSEFASRQAQISSKKQDIENIENHIQRYDALKVQGLVGDPDRAIWVEQMQESFKSMKLKVPYKIELSTAKPIASGSDTASETGGTYQPLMHDMVLEIKDVHEGELLLLINDYKARVKGRFRLENCRLYEPKAQGLEVQCVLRFITIPSSMKIDIIPMAGNMK